MADLASRGTDAIQRICAKLEEAESRLRQMSSSPRSITQGVIGTLPSPDKISARMENVIGNLDELDRKARKGKISEQHVKELEALIRDLDRYDPGLLYADLVEHVLKEILE